MKKLLLVLLLILPFTLFAQNSGPGYVVANDFSTPTAHTTFWLRSSIPAGSVPVFTLSGTNYTTIHTDTLNVPRLALRNDTTIYKLVSIGLDGMLRAFVPKYLVSNDTNSLSNRINSKFNISDTSNKWLSIGYIPNWNNIINKPNFLDSITIYTVINNKLNIADTFGHWMPIGTFIPDTTSLSHRIDLKLNIVDTTNKWLPKSTHIPTDQVNADWNSISGVSEILHKPPLVTSYHQLTDTLNITSTNMNNWNTSYGWGNWALQGFIKGTDTLSLSSRINGKLSTSDTLNKWYPRFANPTGYLVGNDTINLSNGINLKLNSLDTLSISNRINTKLNSIDTLSLSNRVNTKFTIPTGNTGQYLNGLGNPITFPTIPTQVNIIGGQNTKISGSYPNISIADSNTIKLYNTSGFINQSLKLFVDTLSPNTSNGYSINISSVGFTRILSANVIAIRNTNIPATSPNASIKSISTTAITCNIIEDNPATIAILGISVLSGLPSIFANITGLQIAVIVVGY